MAGKAWEEMISIDDRKLNDGELESLQAQFFMLEGPEALTPEWVIENEEIFASSFARKAVDLLKSRLYSNRRVVNSQIQWNTQHRKERSRSLNRLNKHVRNSRKLRDRFFRNAINDGQTINLQEFEFMMREWCVGFDSAETLKSLFDDISNGEQRISIKELREYLGKETITRESLMRLVSQHSNRNSSSGRKQLGKMRRMKKKELRDGVVDAERAMRSMIKFCAIKSRERGRYLFQRQLKEYQDASGVYVVEFADGEDTEVVAIKERIERARQKSVLADPNAHPFDNYTTGEMQENSFLSEEKSPGLTVTDEIAELAVNHHSRHHRRVSADTISQDAANDQSGATSPVSSHTRTNSRSNPYMFAINPAAAAAAAPPTADATLETSSPIAQQTMYNKTNDAQDLISHIVASCDVSSDTSDGDTGTDVDTDDTESEHMDAAALAKQVLRDVGAVEVTTNDKVFTNNELELEKISEKEFSNDDSSEDSFF